jgi:hypothetical protein
MLDRSGGPRMTESPARGRPSIRLFNKILILLLSRSAEMVSAVAQRTASIERKKRQRKAAKGGSTQSTEFRICGTGRFLRPE